MGKRIIALQNASNITNDTYIPVDSESNGVKKISAGFINDIVTDVTVDNTSVVDNGVAAISLSGKQDVLTPGTNIQIQNNTISATDTTYSNFSGTDGTDAGTSGLVPAPTVSDTDKYLKSDGTWGTIASGGSNVTITPSLSSGTKIADYEIDGVEGMLYAPSGGGGGGSTNSYGYTAPADSIGSNGAIYGKIEDVSGEEENAETPVDIKRSVIPKTIPLLRNIEQYASIKISLHTKSNGVDYYFNDLVVNVANISTSSESPTRLYYPGGRDSSVSIYKSSGELIVSYSDWGILAEITSLIGTYTSAHKVTDIYQKVEGHWSKFESGEIPEIEANPSEAPTETLESIKIDGIVYQLPSSANIGNFAFGTANTNSSFETEVQS